MGIFDSFISNNFKGQTSNVGDLNKVANAKIDAANKQAVQSNVWQPVANVINRPIMGATPQAPAMGKIPSPAPNVTPSAKVTPQLNAIKTTVKSPIVQKTPTAAAQTSAVDPWTGLPKGGTPIDTKFSAPTVQTNNPTQTPVPTPTPTPPPAYNPYDVSQFYPSNFQSAQQQYAQSQTPGPQELEAMQKLADLNAQQSALTASYQGGSANVENKPIAMDLIQGQQAALQRQYGVGQSALEAQQTPLTQQLANLQAIRAGQANIASKNLDIAQSLGQMAFQRSQPQAVAAGTNLVRLNPTTGQYENIASGGITPTTEHSNYLQAVNQGFGGTQQDYQNYQKYADAMSAQGLTPVDPNTYITKGSQGAGLLGQDNTVFPSLTQTANNGQKFLDMSKLPPGIGQSQGIQWAQQNGVKVVSSQDAGTLRSIDAVKQQLDSQFKSIQDFLPGGAGAKLLGGPLNNLSAYFQINPQLGSYASYKVGAENQIRALGASGVNEQTINTLLSSLPNIDDTLPTAQNKIDHFNSEYDKIQSSILGAGQEKNTSTITQGMNF